MGKDCYGEMEKAQRIVLVPLSPIKGEFLIYVVEKFNNKPNKWG